MNDISAPAQPLATAIICTRNRAASLERTLNSIVAAARHVSAPWEMLVVDNGSTDDTQQTIEKFKGALPIRSVIQPEPGLSNARNAGVAAALGKYIIWTDDDVLVDEKWLAAYLEAFEANPGAVVFGGTAVPVYQEPKRNWFVKAEPQIVSLLAIRNSPEWSEITSKRIPYGLNYAIRAAEHKKRLYDPELGVAPGRRRGGEETTLIRALLAEGATGAWAWDAKVYHLIPAQRQTLRYIYEFYRAHGQDFPTGGLHFKPASPAWLAFLLPANLVRHSAKLLLRGLTGRKEWVLSVIELARLHGTIDRLRSGEHDWIRKRS